MLETGWTFNDLDDQRAYDIEGLEHFRRIRAGVQAEKKRLAEMRAKAQARARKR